MGLFGLGDFAQTALGTYKALHGMDIDERTMQYKRALAEEESRKRALEEQRLRAELEAKAAEQAAGLEVATGLRGVPSHEIGNALTNLYIKSKNPNAFAAAAKKYLEGSGGILSPESREKSRARNEMSAIIGAHSADPDLVPATAVARSFLRLGIPPAEWEAFIPDITTKADILKAAAIERNKPAAQGAGLLTAPGQVSLPGRPAPVAPPGVPTSGDILASQAGAIAGAEAGGREIGKARALELRVPEWDNMRIGEALARQEGRIAVARETPTKQELADLDKKLKQADIDLKHAALEADPGKRAEVASRTASQLMMSEWIVRSIQDPALKERYQQIMEQARELARRGSLPGRAPARRGPAPADPLGIRR